MLDELAAWNLRNGHPFWFFTELSINVADDRPLLEAMARAGLRRVFIGIETPRSQAPQDDQEGAEHPGRPAREAPPDPRARHPRHRGVHRRLRRRGRGCLRGATGLHPGLRHRGGDPGAPPGPARHPARAAPGEGGASPPDSRPEPHHDPGGHQLRPQGGDDEAPVPRALSGPREGAVRARAVLREDRPRGARAARGLPSRPGEVNAEAPRHVPPARLSAGHLGAGLQAALLEGPAPRPAEEPHGARGLRTRLLLLLPPQPARRLRRPRAPLVPLRPWTRRPPGRRRSRRRPPASSSSAA